MITGEKKSVEEDDLTLIAMLPFANLSGHLYQEMRDYLKKMVGDPLLPLLNISCHQQKPLRDLFKEATTDPPDLANDGSEKYAKVSVNLGVTAVMLNNNSIRYVCVCMHACLRVCGLGGGGPNVCNHLGK